MQRIASTLLLIGVLLCGASMPGSAQPAPVEINTILSLTGFAAFLGAKEQQTLKVLEDVVNRDGGIGGRPVHFVIADDTSSPQVAVQLANGLIAKKMAVIFGPTLTNNCLALEPLVEDAGPVTYCLSPGIAPKPRSYLFMNAPALDDVLPVVLRFFRERNYKRVALIVSNDVIGQDFEKRLAKTMSSSEFRDVTILAREHFNPSDLNLAAQIARIKAVKPDAIMNPTVGTAFGTVLRSMRDGGLDVPLYASGGNMTYAQMSQYGSFLPKDLYFNGARGILPESIATGAMKRAQDVYFGALKQASLRPEFATQIAWDEAMLIVDALRHVGPDATASQVHAYLEGVRNWTGIEGTYDFTSGDQRGIGQSAAAVFRWDAAKDDFALVYPHGR